VSVDAIEISIDAGTGTLPGLWMRPDGARAALVLAHGAGAGMRHRFLAALAGALASRAIATLRYDLPFMAAGRRRPDPPAVAHAAVRAAAAEAVRRAPDLPLLAGGKSFGGRMTSQAQAEAPLPSVRGLVFVGFPLHRAGRPGTERAAHLEKVTVPMLLLQGTRDDLADLALLRPVVDGLAGRAELVVVDGADHAFALPARAARARSPVDEIAEAITAWLGRI